jgi:hypothetical protein
MFFLFGDLLPVFFLFIQFKHVHHPTKHKRDKNTGCIGVISYICTLFRTTEQTKRHSIFQSGQHHHQTPGAGRAAKEKKEGQRQRPETLTKSCRHDSWGSKHLKKGENMDRIAHLCFQFTNFVFSSHPIPEPEENENRARKQWSGVERAHLSHTRLHSSACKSVQATQNCQQIQTASCVLSWIPDVHMSQVNPHPSNIHHRVRIMNPAPIGYAADTYPSCTMIFYTYQADTCIWYVLAVLWFFIRIKLIRVSDTYMNWIGYGRPANKNSLTFSGRWSAFTFRLNSPVLVTTEKASHAEATALVFCSLLSSWQMHYIQIRMLLHVTTAADAASHHIKAGIWTEQRLVQWF